MKILYVSTLTSSRLINNFFATSGKNPGFSTQKFHRMLAKGFVKNNIEFQTLTGLPIGRDMSKKIFWNQAKEIENGVNYNYIPFVNLPGLRHLFLIIYSFFYVLFWGVSNKKNKVIVCDVLNISVCIGSLLASKIIGVKSVGIMTDMPGLMVSRNTNVKHRFRSIIPMINKSYLLSFSMYVFLTEQMNEVINKKNRPYIVMEGLVDESIFEKSYKDMLNVENNRHRILLYAGGLHERYGLKTLVEAFMKLSDVDVQLHLYGDGIFAEELISNYCKKDKRIIYHGIVANEKVVEDEIKATLLINPRPTNEDFTQYSFPSKNMEYMLSGTPVLTTMLPGMPKEYYPHIYVFEDESVEGYAKTLENVLSLSKTELQEKGRIAKEFVLQKKNNVYQTKRILSLINSVYNPNN